MSFADDVRAKLPKALHLPEPFAAVFDWAEARNQVAKFNNASGRSYLSIYPIDQLNADGASYLIFHAEGPPLAEPIPQDITARYASIATAAGDGGKMGFWLDDNGMQQVVIFNQGWPHVLTSDPLVALQFLAVGYPEPAAITDANLTAAETAKAEGYDTPLLADDYRAFLRDSFGVILPDTAAELGIVVPDDDDMSDPMRQWIDKYQR